jgi:hypothetical protein
MSKRCLHTAGWYIREASLLAASDGATLTLFPPNHGKQGARADKVQAICNAGCGATRNVYLTAVEFTFGNIRRKDLEAR